MPTENERDRILRVFIEHMEIQILGKNRWNDCADRPEWKDKQDIVDEQLNRFCCQLSALSTFGAAAFGYRHDVLVELIEEKLRKEGKL